MYQNINDDRFHSRKNPRMREYDYTTPNYYFVTICTHEKKCLFGLPEQLNSFGEIADAVILEIENHFNGVIVDKYVIMPNHIHAIIVLQKTDTALSSVIGQYKSYVTKQIHKISSLDKIWQTSFHDHVIRNQKDYLRIWSYIDTNPVKWQEDCFYCQAFKTE